MRDAYFERESLFIQWQNKHEFYSVKLQYDILIFVYVPVCLSNGGNYLTKIMHVQSSLTCYSESPFQHHIGNVHDMYCSTYVPPVHRIRFQINVCL